MRNLILLTFSCLIFISIFSQESFRLEWEIEDNLSPADAIIDINGNTIIVGMIRKINQNYDGDGFIFKMNPDGDYSYFRYIAEPDSNLNFEEIIQLDNGNYFVFCNYGLNEYDEPNESISICIFSQNLELISEKRIDIPEQYKSIGSNNLIMENQGTILMAGSARLRDAPNTNRDDLALYRFNQQGDTIETKFVHYESNVSVTDIDKVPNSSNYLLLESATQGFGFFECYILKPDLTAECINYFSSWDFSVNNHGLSCDYWYPNKSFMMASGLIFYDKTDEKGLGVFRCDTLANISEYLFLNHTNIFDYQAHRKCISFADENSIYIAGFMTDFWDCNDPDSLELYVVDTALNQVAYKSLGGDISYDATGILTSEDNGAIIYGVAWHPDGEYCHGNLVIYYVNRSDLGLPPVKVFDYTFQGHSPLVFPNPATSVLNILVDKELLNQYSRIKLYNSSGRKVYDYKLPSIGNILQLNIQNLEQGFYLYEVTSKNKIISNGKFIKQ